jgi:hypothetical protein
MSEIFPGRIQKPIRKHLVFCNVRWCSVLLPPQIRHPCRHYSVVPVSPTPTTSVCSADTVSHIIPLKRRYYISCFSCRHWKCSIYTVKRWFITVCALKTLTIMIDKWCMGRPGHHIILIKLCMILIATLNSEENYDIESGPRLNSETTSDNCSGS